MPDDIKKLSLWEAVSKTDPAMTKKVNQRGGFTAIDAYYQIQLATKQFGPVGEGWGWVVEEISFPPNNTVMVHIQMWQGHISNSFDVVGMKSLTMGSKPDEDCVKKAVTDAITKGLSYLGFNADVFLGKFDDNKYIEQRTREEQKQKVETAKASIFDGPHGEFLRKLQEGVSAVKTEAEFKDLYAKNLPHLTALKDNDIDAAKLAGSWLNAKKKELGIK